MQAVAIAGAGLSGAVIARELAQAGIDVTVFEARDHVAGTCHTRRDPDTGVLQHVYGPHIFHTDNEEVWNYVRQFDTFMPFTNRVKAISDGSVYSLPVNLLTINQFFGKTFNPQQARDFIAGLAARPDSEPGNFEEQALCFVGRELYEAFFKGYTVKQWGRDPRDLPASILKRLPLRFNYDDNYYASAWQGMPLHGYSAIVEKMLDHPRVAVHLNTGFERPLAAGFGHVFYSGPIDAWFDHCEGRLGYRTLDFEQERHAGDYQGNAVINYCNTDVPWTRITEHKHFAPWERHDHTVIYREFSRECEEGDIPYYPIRLAQEKTLLARYVALGQRESGISFVGRLGTYRYLDMHVTIAEALAAARRFLACMAKGEAMPAFIQDPLASSG